jgi:hypothetical protein
MANSDGKPSTSERIVRSELFELSQYLVAGH